MVRRPPPAGYFPRQRAIYSLKRAKLRPSWHKINLYHMIKYEPENFENQKYFAQKWRAKSSTRAYHGIQIRERKWENMFQRRVSAVVPMDPQELAVDDGSKWSSGRGSGLQDLPEATEPARPGVREDVGGYESSGEVTQNFLENERTPFMQMLYAPIERRLDSAIHRALFASSVRQARQFVLHGSVKVNGKKMRHPGYLLNPGDLFQVEPDMVMYACGARKENPIERRAGRVAKGLVPEKSRPAPHLIAPADGPVDDTKSQASANQKSGKAEGQEANPQPAKSNSSSDSAETNSSPSAQLEDFPLEEKYEEDEEEDESEYDDFEDDLDDDHEFDNGNDGRGGRRRKEIKMVGPKYDSPHEGVLVLARFLHEPLGTDSSPSPDEVALKAPPLKILSPFKRVQYRRFHESLEVVLGGSSKPRSELQDIDSQLAEVAAQLSLHIPDKVRFIPSTPAAGKIQTGPATGKYAGMVNAARLSEPDRIALRSTLEALRRNPVDDTKPYATPWRPRDYMSPWAFIPRYLEVNQKICAAVYIRHPVARPGQTEVPSPFDHDTQQLAYTWYLRKR